MSLFNLNNSHQLPLQFPSGGQAFIQSPYYPQQKTSLSNKRSNPYIYEGEKNSSLTKKVKADQLTQVVRQNSPNSDQYKINQNLALNQQLQENAFNSFQSNLQTLQTSFPINSSPFQFTNTIANNFVQADLLNYEFLNTMINSQRLAFWDMQKYPQKIATPNVPVQELDRLCDNLENECNVLVKKIQNLLAIKAKHQSNKLNRPALKTKNVQLNQASPSLYTSSTSYNPNIQKEVKTWGCFPNPLKIEENLIKVETDNLHKIQSEMY